MPETAQPRYASVDVTARCPLRCAHCYFYRRPVEGDDLPEERFLGGLRALRGASSVDCMLWLGGEPLARPGTVVRGSRLFRRNALFTNGLLPIPAEFAGGVAVSLDGPEPVHDSLRGRGTFGRILKNLEGGRDRLFHCTITRSNRFAIRPLAEALSRVDAAGLLFGFYSPLIGEAGAWPLTARERDAAVDDLQDLAAEYPLVLNTPASLDLMRPGSVPAVAARCMYRTGEAVALDHRLRAKRPCSYGAGADCSRCGCPALFLRAAAVGGDGAARGVLAGFFRAA